MLEILLNMLMLLGIIVVGALIIAAVFAAAAVIVGTISYIRKGDQDNEKRT